MIQSQYNVAMYVYALLIIFICDHIIISLYMNYDYILILYILSAV